MPVYRVEAKVGMEAVAVPVVGACHQGGGFTTDGEAAVLAAVEARASFPRIVVTDLVAGCIEVVVDGGRVVEPVELAVAGDALGMDGLAALLRERVLARCGVAS